MKDIFIVAIITGSVTLTAGIAGQVIGHRLTKKRDEEKTLKEVLSEVYSPLSIHIYQYLYEYGKLLEFDDDEKENQEQILNSIWEEIEKLVTTNKKFVTAELTHNFQQKKDNGNYDKLSFFSDFFREYKKLAKTVKFKGENYNYSPNELIFLLKFHRILFLRFGPASSYLFRVMNSRHDMPTFKKIYKTVKKEKIEYQAVEQESFDKKFEELVLNNLQPPLRDKWESYIKDELTKRKNRKSSNKESE